VGNDLTESVRSGYNRIAAAYALHYANELQHKPLDRELLTRFAAEIKGRGDVCDMGEDPEMRPEPITPEKREELIAYMAAGLLAAHKYFRERWIEYADTTIEPPRRAAKIGRNEPCPCGSGKNYKKCCGGTTVN
jgi:uncharacterized protein YecA (UPF0149 family)